MKKLTLLFIALFTLVLASCSSDDDSSNNISGNLTGIWIGNTINYTGTTVSTYQGQDSSSDFVGEGFNVDYTVTFTENPNNVTSEGSYDVELTTTFEGQSNTQTITGQDFFAEGTWELSGNELTITNDNEEATFTITELTDTSLTIELSTQEEVSEQGFDITSSVNLIATFTRE